MWKRQAAERSAERVNETGFDQGLQEIEKALVNEKKRSFVTGEEAYKELVWHRREG